MFDPMVSDDDLAVVHRSTRNSRIVERAREQEKRHASALSLSSQMHEATTRRTARRRSRFVVALWIIAAAVTCACAGAFLVWSFA